MKALFFIDWYLPGYKAGGPIRSMANMVDNLGDKLDIFIITGNTDYMEKEPYREVIINEWNKLPTGEQVYYVENKIKSFFYYWKIFKSYKFDCIYIHGIYSWRYSILPLIVSKVFGYKKIIVAPRGMLADSAIRIKKIKKIFFLLFAKLSGLYRNIIFHATNEKEKNDIICKLLNKAKVVVAENLPRKYNELSTFIKKEKGTLKLISLTRISPEKNILFAMQILSELQSCDFIIVYDIYGQIYDRTYWEKCQHMIQLLPDNIKVQYKGTILPNEVGGIIKSYHCLFLPTTGENFGHAILESLMSSRPVIISDKTPWIFLSRQYAGWDISLENKFEFMQIIMLLVNMEQSEYDKWCKGAFLFADNFIKKSNTIEKYIEMFKGNN